MNTDKIADKQNNQAPRTALITGSGRNIGRAIAIELAKEGCNIILNGSSDRAACESVAREIESTGTNVLIAMGDVGVREDVLCRFISVLYVRCIPTVQSGPVVVADHQDWANGATMAIEEFNADGNGRYRFNCATSACRSHDTHPTNA